MLEHPTAREVLVLAGGEPVEGASTPPLPSADWVIAADSGLAVAATLGLDVDLVVGDMDSVDAELLAEAERAGARVERHPRAKDATDLALALDAALEAAPARVTVVGGAGGRLDHLLAGALLLAAPRYAPLALRARMGPATVTVVRDEAELVGEPGELVSLVAAHGPARGVTTTGLAYPLSGETLEPGSTRGVSNELTSARAHLSVTEGALLAIQPGAQTAHDPTAAQGAS